MPIEILIAPAAPAAESAGDFWKYGFPILTLILGFGMKAGFDYFMEGRRDGKQSRHRWEQRYDALRLRRLEAERENLLALQPLMVRFVRAATIVMHQRQTMVAAGSNWGQAMASDQAKEELRVSAAELVPFHARIHTEQVVAALNAVIKVVMDAMDATFEGSAAKSWQQVDVQNKMFHKVLGDSIKALEDENQLLGAPPAG